MTIVPGEGMRPQQIDEVRRTLLARKAELVADLASIRRQINQAMTRPRKDDWWGRVNEAEKIKKRELQQIEDRLASLNQEEERSMGTGLHVSPSMKTAVLFKIAHAAADLLYDEDEIDDEDAENNLDKALTELDKLVPGWRDRKKEMRG